MKNYFKFFIVIIFFFGIYFLLNIRNNSIPQAQIQKDEKVYSFIKINDTFLNVEIADTVERRTLGLSNRNFLLENNGMLFVFPQKEQAFFWMKDMNFPLDIIWFDENRKIIHIEKDIKPETFPKLFSAESPALYVLEVVSGFSEKNNLKIGDEFIFVEN